MSSVDMPAASADTSGFPQSLPGILWGLGATAIWSGWWVATRSSVTGGLAGPDLAALRFGIAGMLLWPVLWRHRAQLVRVPPALLLVMAAGSGAPYALVAALGLTFASAGNGGALTLGMLPVFTAALSALVLDERIGRRRTAGTLVIAVGALTIIGPGLGTAGAWPGHLLFVLGAAMWSGFTVAMRRSGLGPITATAVVCVFSLVGYLPIYLTVVGPANLLGAPAREIALQSVFQGGLSAIGAMYCYCQAIARLGTTRTATFAALVPVLATLLGVAVLAESPSTVEIVGVALLSLGIHVAARDSQAGRREIPRRALPFPTLVPSLASTPAPHHRTIAAIRGTSKDGEQDD